MKVLSKSTLHLHRASVRPRPLVSRRPLRRNWSLRCTYVDSEIDEEEEWIEDTLEDIDYKELRTINLLEPQPGMLQQTLWRSFVIGGIGFHSGERSIVRVRPAFAGDGRYFVRVPEKTNEHLFSPVGEQLMRIYPSEEAVIDGEAEAYRSELFLKYLEYKERVGYVRDFRQFLIEYHELKGKILEEHEVLVNREEAVPKSSSEPIIPATLRYLSTEAHTYETSLENFDGDRVESVEHLLAALEACGIDNARIEIEGGPEVPVVDGSALGWTIEIERKGVTLAECPGKELGFLLRGARKLNKIVKVQDGESFVMLIPGDKMRITYGIDHTNECPRIGSQWFSWCLQDDKHFKLHLAAAKTYVPAVEDLIRMRDAGYAKAGSEHVVVIGDGMEWYDETVLSYSLDEPVRHKMLDLIGDLSLLGEEGMGGLPFGHIIAFKADHELHLKFAKEIKKQCGTDYDFYIHPSEAENIDEEDGPVINMGPMFETEAYRQRSERAMSVDTTDSVDETGDALDSDEEEEAEGDDD